MMEFMLYYAGWMLGISIVELFSKHASPIFSIIFSLLLGLPIVTALLIFI